MAHTDIVIVLYDGLHLRRYVNYGALIVRCSLYRKQIEICYECGMLGHRADVGPNPGENICRGCGVANPTQKHQCDQNVRYAGMVTTRETDAARQNIRYRFWSSEGAGSDEEEKKQRPKDSTASTTTTSELAKERARTPTHRKDNEPKAQTQDYAVGTVANGPVPEPGRGPGPEPVREPNFQPRQDQDRNPPKERQKPGHR
ncbi:hypothetical protein HPB49_025790 [Dermacentor silvarum]|nr:hypothetical protein HPB49_025790 [Dermacentor silvarum]